MGSSSSIRAFGAFLYRFSNGRSCKIAGRKGAQDARKAKLYAKIGKEVVSAVKKGSKVQFYYYLRAHYNVILKSIEVGDAVLQLPSNGFDTHSGKSMIMESGATLAYLGDELFNPLMKKILVAQPNLKLLRVQQQFTCFKFSGSACTTSTCSFDWTKCKSIGSFPPGS
ncbi:putative transcriptional regulatory protein [Camellia lanceoleosa]|uniref:Transcriptional regulatory protein n=1 Tax=Camellia lanceoleosa TaxID=1840588 RepID=A0ACC0FLJ1_9ERIC|nr:putative transcriptional regulatory protein [Camellia lanceoleosa]